MTETIKKNPKRRNKIQAVEREKSVSDELKQLAVKHETEVEQPSVNLKYLLPIGLAAIGFFFYTTREKVPECVEKPKPVGKPMPIEKQKPDPKPKPKPKERIF